MGALNLYCRQENGFQDDPWEVSDMLVGQAAVSLANVQAHQSTRKLAEGLKEALESRDTIGRAKGILMHQHGLTDGQAFDYLVELSQRTNHKLRDVAAATSAAGRAPDPE